MTIASEITRLQGAKVDIKTAIEGKGVSVPSNAKLDTYDVYINQIDTNSDIHYTSGNNYAWDGQSEGWYRGDEFSLVSNATSSQRIINYEQILRFDNGEKYVIGGFLPIDGYQGSGYRRTYVSPFEYYVIDKTTEVLTKGRGGASNFQTYFGGVNGSYVIGKCLMPRDGWIEYETEYRNYYGTYNWSQTSTDRNGNCYGYFYIKKDLSAMGYVSATDSFNRDQYGLVQTDYNTEHDGTYSRDYADLFPDYNTGKIGPYDSSNVTYKGKLYTPAGYHMFSNSGNNGFQYLRVYY